MVVGQFQYKIMPCLYEKNDTTKVYVHVTSVGDR